MLCYGHLQIMTFPPPLRSETGSDGKSFASLTKELSSTDARSMSFKNTARKQRPIVVGASATNKHN